MLSYDYPDIETICVDHLWKILLLKIICMKIIYYENFYCSVIIIRGTPVLFYCQPK